MHAQIVKKGGQQTHSSRGCSHLTPIVSIHVISENLFSCGACLIQLPRQYGTGTGGFAALQAEHAFMTAWTD